MNSSINNTDQQYKQCAGKNCFRDGKYELKILFINKTGYFCEPCSKYIVESKIGILTDGEDSKYDNM